MGRAKSACKEKVELFNSTAPIKFFSNLEETVREITTLNGASLKLSSSKRRQSSQNRQKDQIYANPSAAEELKIIQGGTQQIIVPKIQQAS